MKRHLTGTAEKHVKSISSRCINLKVNCNICCALILRGNTYCNMGNSLAPEHTCVIMGIEPDIARHNISLQTYKTAVFIGRGHKLAILRHRLYQFFPCYVIRHRKYHAVINCRGNLRGIGCATRAE